MTLGDDALLALHRRLVAIRSVSGEEAEIAGWVESLLRENGVEVERLGNSVLAWHRASAQDAPIVLLNSHLDTVPAAPGWTLDPWTATRADGKVIGLGANDAKASVAAMIAAFLDAAGKNLPFTLALGLVEGEETKGIGAERLAITLRERSQEPAAVVVGEPTGLDLAIAQKGLLVLELVAQGDAAHAAHARRLGARNAVRCLARDLVALEALDLGPEHPQLGQATCEPTLLRGGTARNVVPAEAAVILDVRTVPGEDYAALIGRVQAIVDGEVRVLSERLKPCGTDPDAAIVRAAQAARPQARLYGSPTLSDWVHFRAYPAVKIGPGDSDRSHRPNEYLHEQELLDGARFYRDLLAAYARAIGA
jgi:acetylornithine deacetylase